MVARISVDPARAAAIGVATLAARALGDPCPMTDPDTSADALYRTLAQHYGVALGASRGRGFGSNALKTEGRIFAALSNGRLLLKLPAGRVDALVEAKLGERFSTGPGRVKKEWVTIGPSSAEEWTRLAEEARNHVRSQAR